MGMEGAPNDNIDGVPVKKPYYVDGKLCGYELGRMYTELPLNILETSQSKTIEFETESGNVYVIRMIQMTDVDKQPNLYQEGSSFLIQNTRTGSVQSLSQSDIENGILRVGQPFEWAGGNSTNIKNVLIYSKGSVYSNIK